MENAEELDLLHKQMEFSGAKIALICDDKLLTILRDDISTIPWPNMWDLCMVFQDKGMVAFYEKNGYHQTHTEPEKEDIDMVYMTKTMK